jgi:predicted DNA-binding protein (UPF0251 family)
MIDLFFEQQISREEIGKRFGVTGQSVTMIINAALKKVRDYMDKQDRLAVLGIRLPNNPENGKTETDKLQTR